MPNVDVSPEEDENIDEDDVERNDENGVVGHRQIWVLGVARVQKQVHIMYFSTVTLFLEFLEKTISQDPHVETAVWIWRVSQSMLELDCLGLLLCCNIVSLDI